MTLARLFKSNLLVPVSVLAALSFLAACGSGPTAGTLSGKSASQIIAVARSAADHEDSMHFLDQTTQSGKTNQHLIGDVSTTNGQEELSNPDGVLYVRHVGGTIFVKGDALVLENALDLSSAVASKNAGKWISLERTNAPYETVAEALLPTAELDPYIPSGHLKVGNPQNLHGHEVVPVSGSAPAAAGAAADATIYVSVSSPHVPVGGSLVGTGSHKDESEVAVFDSWGETVRVSAPSGAIAYSSIS